MSMNGKTQYALTDAISGQVLADSYQYNDDLGLMWAMRQLPHLKKDRPELSRCRLWAIENKHLRRVQTFKKGR